MKIIFFGLVLIILKMYNSGIQINTKINFRAYINLYMHLYMHIYLNNGNNIDIYVDSSGGYVEYGINIMKLFIKFQDYGYNIRCHINKAMSMAAIIMLQCDEIIIHSESRVMYHFAEDISLGLGNIYDLIKLNKILLEFVHNKNKLPYGILNKLFSNETILKGKEIIEFGFNNVSYISI